ncbi:AI-2E family transporter [Streptococcus zalophi]|uniref:AI-2E family transporter n=1 Tax=Streptococcus zalophi TaxID=640031 RepID=A0A934PA68_9STRE|nr:AI-2E family transporter [Streptococcus zalophi]MBJ8349640.1 AI-2E family transporter [Streptococcus zalophi]
MNNFRDKKFSFTWFFKWFVDNKANVVLLSMLLVFLNIFILIKISFIFQPIITIISIIMLPIVISGLLYYLLEPIVSFLEKKGLNKIVSITIVFVMVLGFLVLGIASIVPTIQTQITSFIKNLPDYITQLESQLTELLKDDRLEAMRPQLSEMIDNFSQTAIDFVQSFSSQAVDWASRFASALTKVMLALLISPFILFYLLRDSNQIKGVVVSYLPIKIRKPMARILTDVNKQLSGYVQGQVTVAIVVGLMFSIMFNIIQLPYAITLGIMAGFLNMIPYLGSFLAMVPVVILAMVDGPIMLVKVIIVFTIEQTIEGRFVTPLVLGSKLNIHPITILFILLTTGSMFGLWGVLLGIPVYASLKVVIIELFEWYKSVSGLYEEDKREKIDD